MRRAAIALVRLYQLTLAAILGGQCRYAPSCSAYAIEAFDRFGTWRGGRMALARVLRCHPWARGGHDPVPPVRSVRPR